MHTVATMKAICQLRIDFVLYERFRELALECSYPYQSKAVMGINRKLQSNIIVSQKCTAGLASYVGSPFLSVFDGNLIIF